MDVLCQVCIVELLPPYCLKHSRVGIVDLHKAELMLAHRLAHKWVVQAKSGMGKTAVFVLTTLQQLDPQVLSPRQLLPVSLACLAGG